MLVCVCCVCYAIVPAIFMSRRDKRLGHLNNRDSSHLVGILRELRKFAMVLKKVPIHTVTVRMDIFCKFYVLR